MRSFWSLRQLLVERVSPQLRRQTGLEVPDVFLLSYIGSSSLSPSEIAAQMRVPPHNISRRLDVLEKRDLITRSLGTGDARRRVLTLTPAGESVLARGTALLEEHVAKLLEVLNPAAQTVMLEALERLTSDLPGPVLKNTSDDSPKHDNSEDASEETR